jgi:hypothetical protein
MIVNEDRSPLTEADLKAMTEEEKLEAANADLARVLVFTWFKEDKSQPIWTVVYGMEFELVINSDKQLQIIRNNPDLEDIMIAAKNLTADEALKLIDELQPAHPDRQYLAVPIGELKRN